MTTRLATLALALTVPVNLFAAETETCQWEPVEIVLQAQGSHDWWEFPVAATFTHAETGTQISLSGYASSGRQYTVRFAPPLPGRWNYTTKSPDHGLDGQTGVIIAAKSDPAAVAANANLRGHVRIASSGRHFEYADGTPVFLLADTGWSMNTARCGLGTNGAGPFFTYLADRQRQGFNTILVAYMRGFGDTNEPAGQRNEGGHPFVDGDTSKPNFDHFAKLDRRIDAIWREGFILAGHPTWFGKRNCFFALDEARRISQYLAVRYGAYNAVWSLSGEYQYAMRDCGWSADSISQIGRAVRARNAYGHPLSIHPSGRTDWQAPHGCQSSRPFHESGWLDHHWLQTGQSTDRMYNIVGRLEENRALKPARPVFLAESYYERATDPDRAYHARWQAWSALLNGAAGYGHGTFGIWQFYDPDDPQGETGKNVSGVVPWQQALVLEGSRQFPPLRHLLTEIEWWNLVPARERLIRDGRPVSLPGPENLTPPSHAATPGGLHLVYIPRGNEKAELALSGLDGPVAAVEWYDPRSGRKTEAAIEPASEARWVLPRRPEPAGEDWIAIIQTSE